MNWGPYDMLGRGVGITGGGGHLGRSMASLLADAGATVLILGRSEDKLQQVADECRNSRGRILPFVGNIMRDNEIARALETLRSEAGHVDGWVNNAYSGAGGRLLEYTREELETTTRSLTDVMMVTQQIAQVMIADKKPGAIVNISSMYGIVSPYPEVYRDHREWHSPPAYGAVKAGIIQFTRYASTHLALHDIRVNCVTPGPFPNDTVQQDSLFLERLAERVPMGRIGQRHEVAGAVVFLLSDAASYITGANLVVDGGWTSW